MFAFKLSALQKNVSASIEILCLLLPSSRRNKTIVININHVYQKQLFILRGPWIIYLGLTGKTAHLHKHYLKKVLHKFSGFGTFLNSQAQKKSNSFIVLVLTMIYLMLSLWNQSAAETCLIYSQLILSKALDMSN